MAQPEAQWTNPPMPASPTDRRPPLNLETTLALPTDDAVASLRRLIRGAVIVPGDDEYDGARALMYGGLDLHPAAIARVLDAADVATTIGIARETGLELAVRSGGHSIAGHS